MVVTAEGESWADAGRKHEGTHFFYLCTKRVYVQHAAKSPCRHVEPIGLHNAKELRAHRQGCIS